MTETTISARLIRIPDGAAVESRGDPDSGTCPRIGTDARRMALDAIQRHVRSLLRGQAAR